MATKTTKKSLAAKGDRPQKEGKFIYAKGARKTATAKVRLYIRGKGEFEVNGLPYEQYFETPAMRRDFLRPLVITNHEKVDLTIHVAGSGKASQAQACRHGIARALVALDENFKPLLKAEGLMTRDPRVKERKKPGLKRARRAPQWSKR